MAILDPMFTHVFSISGSTLIRILWILQKAILELLFTSGNEMENILGSLQILVSYFLCKLSKIFSLMFLPNLIELDSYLIAALLIIYSSINLTVEVEHPTFAASLSPPMCGSKIAPGGHKQGLKTGSTCRLFFYLLMNIHI